MSHAGSKSSIALRFLLAAAAASCSLSARAELEPGCPDHYYLGNNPSYSEAPDWSENAQGVANDGRHWYFTHVSGLIKYDAHWYDIDDEADAGRIQSVGIPAVLSAGSIWHFGDPDYYKGYVFVPFEGDGEPLAAVIAVFRAYDLAFVDWFNLDPSLRRSGWVAIDPVEQVLYTSHDEIVASTPLMRYAIDVSKIENGIDGDFLQPIDRMYLRDFDGSPVSGIFGYMQGGVFTPWGDLYLSVGKADESPEDTRGGLHLLRRTSDGTAFQLIESSVNQDAPYGANVFSYQYSTDSLGLGQEPEGIDWWNRDSDPDSEYEGQLHAILLDNQLADDDEIWLKHYRVVYLCTFTDDSDDDGLQDGDEAYAYNTHPLIADTDEDGQSDGHELSCNSDPLDAASVAPDADSDGMPNCIDADDDNDGQSDVDELACGSNPRSPTSLSPDFDGDGRPDCVDSDDDNDGTQDAADVCSGTPMSLGSIEYAGCNSGITDFLLTSQAGCSVSQWIDVLAAQSRTKGQLVKSVDKLLNDLQKEGVLAPNEKDAVKSCVAR